MTSATPRIATLSKEDALAAAEAVGVLPQIAELNVFRTLLKHPKLAKAVNDLLLMLLFDGNCLPHRLRELLIMRIGWVTGSNYEWTQHWRIALEQFDVPEADLLAVRDWQRADCFGPADCAVLAATDETLEHGHISQKTWAACAAHLDAGELVDLVAAIGTWGLIAQLVHSLEVSLEEGVSSWPPDGRSPA